MNRNYLKICFKILNYCFNNLLNTTNYKFIYVDDICLSDSKKIIYSVTLHIILFNNYSFEIYLDFVNDRFYVKAFNDVDFRSYKLISGILGDFK